jgi:cation:H+ antiporter
MVLASFAIICGLVLLVWSADRFVEGAAATAKHAGLPSIIIGMVIVGFGTSAPEMVVSAIAASNGNPDLALGNALGSNIVNISLILGISALISPIAVKSAIVKKEIPILLMVVLFCGYLLYDGNLSALDGKLLLLGLLLFIGWSIYSGLRHPGDTLETEFKDEIDINHMSLGKAIFWVLAGLIVLIASSRILVWGRLK